MGQNLFAFVARAFAGGAEALNLDADGNLRVTLDTGPAVNTPVASSSGNVAAGAAVATLPAAAGKTTYVTSATITGSGATAASVVNAALTGTIAELDYSVAVPAGVTTGIAPLVLTFDPPLPASALNTAIVLTLPSLGAGNTHAAVTLIGFQA